MKPIHLLLVILFFLTACAPAVPEPSVTDLPQPTAIASTPEPVPPTLTPVPTAIVPPTPAFPLSIDDPLPAFAPINAENASNLTLVARLDTEAINAVFLAEKQDKILLNTGFGVQVIDRATFSAESYKPQLGIVFGREFSPDGRRMVQLLPGNPKLFDLSLVVTDLQSGKKICSAPETLFPSNTNQLVFHADGSITYLTSGSDSSLRRWNADCQLTFNEKPQWPVMDFSDDGQQAAVGNGNELFIYSTNGGSKNRLAEISNLRGAYFLSDGKSILVTSKAGNAIYDLASGEKKQDFPGSMGDYFASYKLSRDGKWILINAYKQNRALRLSDYTLHTLPGDFINLSDNPLQHNFDQIENGYVITKDYIWDIEKQGKIASLKKYGDWNYQMRVLISADRTRAAVSPLNEPHSIDILDLTNGKLLYTIPDYSNPIALPDDSGFIATSRGKTAFFDYTDLQPLQVLDLHYVEGQALQNGDLIVWDNQGNLHQLDPTAHDLLHSTRLPFVLSEAKPQNLAPAWAQGKSYPFDDFLASFMTPRWSQWVLSHNRQTGLREAKPGVVQFFKMRENSEAWQAVLPEDVISISTPGDVYEMVFSPDDRFAAGVFEKKLVVWDAATGQELRTIPLAVPPGAVNDFEFSPDGSKLLLSHEKSTRDFSNSIHTDASLRVYETQTGRQLKFFDLKQTFRKSGCNIGLPFAMTSDGSQLITITENCRLGIFDTAAWELKQEFHDPFKDANIDLALSPDNRLLAVAYQNKLELWDLPSAKLIKPYFNPALNIYPRHRDAELGYIYQVAFSPDGALLGSRFSGEYGMTYNSVITLWGMP